MARIAPFSMWMVAGRIPSGRTTRLLRIARSPAMEKVAEEILRHAPAVSGYGANVVDGTDFLGQRGQRIASRRDRLLRAEAAQRNRRDARQGDAGLARVAVLHARETDFRDRLRPARADLAVVLAPAVSVAPQGDARQQL